MVVFNIASADIAENDHKIEKTEDRVTRIITWTLFRAKSFYKIIMYQIKKI